jgi:hypothetical protein
LKKSIAHSEDGLAAADGGGVDEDSGAEVDAGVTNAAISKADIDAKHTGSEGHPSGIVKMCFRNKSV